MNSDDVPTNDALVNVETSGIVFFLDHNIGGRRVVQAMREAGALCEILRDYFDQDASDEEWLCEVGQRGWYVLTKDKRIAHRVNEIQALREAEVGAFVLSSDDLTGEQIATIVVAVLPKLYAFISENQRPFIAKFFKDGRVEAWK